MALANLLHDAEDATWRLAQSVHGWGRIAAVERLANTQEPAIKAWLLREGFRNSIMFEYLVYIAATKGELLEALSAPEIDDGLLIAAAEILAALIAGGPAEQIEDYRDGASACAAFLTHAALLSAYAMRSILQSKFHFAITACGSSNLMSPACNGHQLPVNKTTKDGTTMKNRGAERRLQPQQSSCRP